MKTISIDLETYSDVDLQKCGVYKYAQSENFEILLFGYSVDGGEVSVVDIAQGEIIPDEIIKALADERVIKWAFNASFERVCLSEYLRKYYEKDFISYSIKLQKKIYKSSMTLIIKIWKRWQKNMERLLYRKNTWKRNIMK